MWNRYSVTRRSLRSRPAYRFKRAITFNLTVGSPLNFYKSLRMPFVGVDVESLQGEAKVSALRTRVPVRKGHNF